MATVTYAQLKTLDTTCTMRAGRALLVAPPPRHVYLHSSRAKRINLWSSVPSTVVKGMDGVPQITVSQLQRVTMTAYVETVNHTAITQSTVQSVTGFVFRPSRDGGDPLLEFAEQVSDAVFNTTQTDAIDPDGYNFKIEFDLEQPGVVEGGSAYVLEAQIELTTGEFITLSGRVQANPVFSRPLNVW